MCAAGLVCTSCSPPRAAAGDVLHWPGVHWFSVSCGGRCPGPRAAGGPRSAAAGRTPHAVRLWWRWIRYARSDRNYLHYRYYLGGELDEALLESVKFSTLLVNLLSFLIFVWITLGCSCPPMYITPWVTGGSERTPEPQVGNSSTWCRVSRRFLSAGTHLRSRVFNFLFIHSYRFNLICCIRVSRECGELSCFFLDYSIRSFLTFKNE